MKLLDAHLGEIAIYGLEDDYYNILEGQILNSIVVIAVWFHRTVADKLVDGRVGSW